jgi:hypothetical protein
MDADAVSSGLAFLESELEKLDPMLREPLTNTTYPRDIDIESGGGWVEATSAFNVEYGVTGGEADGVGGLASTSEMNAVTMIVRYANATQSTAAAVNELAGSMENLLKDLISAKYAEGRTKSVDSVMFELCRRIHQAAPMKKDDLPCFAEWLRAWKTV